MRRTKLIPDHGWSILIWWFNRYLILVQCAGNVENSEERGYSDPSEVISGISSWTVSVQWLVIEWRALLLMQFFIPSTDTKYDIPGITNIRIERSVWTQEPFRLEVHGISKHILRCVNKQVHKVSLRIWWISIQDHAIKPLMWYMSSQDSPNNNQRGSSPEIGDNERTLRNSISFIYVLFGDSMCKS